MASIAFSCDTAVGVVGKFPQFHLRLGLSKPCQPNIVAHGNERLVFQILHRLLKSFLLCALNLSDSLDTPALVQLDVVAKTFEPLLVGQEIHPFDFHVCRVVALSSLSQDLSLTLLNRNNIYTSLIFSNTITGTL